MPPSPSAISGARPASYCNTGRNDGGALASLRRNAAAIGKVDRADVASVTYWLWPPQRVSSSSRTLRGAKSASPLTEIQSAA